MFFLRAILYGIGIPTLGIALIIALSTRNKPSNIPRWKLSNNDIQRAKDIVHANQQATGQFVTLDLTERDLNIANTYLLNLHTDTQTHIQIKTDYIVFYLLFTLSENSFGKYIPIQFQLYLPQGRVPKIRNLSIGKIAVADVFAGLLIENAITYTRLNQYLELISKNIKEIYIHSQHLHLKYQLPEGSRTQHEKIRQTTKQSLNESTFNIDQDALDNYQQVLVTMLNKHDPAWLLSLSDVLQTLFQFAQQRSTITNAITESRLALFVANRYVNNSPRLDSLQPIPKYSAYLYKRNDMAKHFMWSATISALGASQFAQMIGLEKELQDAKSGSGFSFIDLAADRAGIRFGKQATASPEQAMKIQQQMANIKHYQAFMPNVKDLPESLSSEEFIAQYQSVYSQKYQSMLRKIDQRIADCEIYRE